MSKGRVFAVIITFMVFNILHAVQYKGTFRVWSLGTTATRVHGHFSVPLVQPSISVTRVPSVTVVPGGTAWSLGT